MFFHITVKSMVENEINMIGFIPHLNGNVGQKRVEINHKIDSCATVREVQHMLLG